MSLSRRREIGQGVNPNFEFEATPPESDEPVLREIFGFHPLARTDRAAPYPARS